MNLSGEENAPIAPPSARAAPDIGSVHQWLALPAPTPLHLMRAGNYTRGLRSMHALFAAARRADEFADRERYNLKRRLRDANIRSACFKRRLQRAVWYNAWQRRTGQRYAAGMRSLFP